MLQLVGDASAPDHDDLDTSDASALIVTVWRNLSPIWRNRHRFEEVVTNLKKAVTDNHNPNLFEPIHDSLKKSVTGLKKFVTDLKKPSSITTTPTFLNPFATVPATNADTNHLRRFQSRHHREPQTQPFRTYSRRFRLPMPLQTHSQRVCQTSILYLCNFFLWHWYWNLWSLWLLSFCDIDIEIFACILQMIMRQLIL